MIIDLHVPAQRPSQDDGDDVTITTTIPYTDLYPFDHQIT